MKKLTMNPHNRVYYSDSYIKGWENGVRDQFEMIKDKDWIPVSRKLPMDDDYNEYLVIDKDGDMAIGNYRHDAKAWDSSNFGWLETKNRTHEPLCGIGSVVAWMPLPPKYNGE